VTFYDITLSGSKALEGNVELPHRQ